MRSDEEILKELQLVTTGLLVVSESDYPLEPFCWPGQIVLTPEFLCEISGSPLGAPIKETDLDSFFQHWEQFRNVTSLLKQHLAEIKVYQVGTINISVYIVGRSPAGNWLGLSTRLIQT